MDEIKLNGYETYIYGIGTYTIQAPENFAANSKTFFFLSKIHIDIPITACVCHIVYYFHMFEPYAKV